jgi:hypothetical protein
MARTRIRNVSGGAASLPLPYSGAIPPGAGVIVADSIATVIVNLGAAVGPIFRLESVPDGNPVSNTTPTGTVTAADLATAAVTTEKIADLAVTYEKISYVDPLGIRPCFMIANSFVVGVGGVADDYIIYDANAPFPFRILDIQVLVSTAVSGGILTLRNAKTGAGVALSDGFTSASLGRQWDGGSILTTPVIPAGGTLVLRRSNNLCAGELLVFTVRVPAP